MFLLLTGLAFPIFFFFFPLFFWAMAFSFWALGFSYLFHHRGPTGARLGLRRLFFVFVFYIFISAAEIRDCSVCLTPTISITLHLNSTSLLLLHSFYFNCAINTSLRIPSYPAWSSPINTASSDLTMHTSNLSKFRSTLFSKLFSINRFRWRSLFLATWKPADAPIPRRSVCWGFGRLGISTRAWS